MFAVKIPPGFLRFVKCCCFHHSSLLFSRRRHTSVMARLLLRAVSNTLAVLLCIPLR